MKKLLFIFFLFCSLFAVAYKWFIVHPGYAPKVNSYGNLYNRLIADSAVHIPNKTCLCTNDNDTTPQLFIYMDTLRGFWNGTFKNIGFGSGGGSGVDTIYVTQIGTGSPQIPLVYAVNGSLRVARLVPGVFTTPFMNADSAAGINIDTVGAGGIAYKAWIIAQYGPPMGGSGTNIYNSNGILTGDRHLSGSGTHNLFLDSLLNLTVNVDGQGGATTIFGPNQSDRFSVDNNDIWLNNAGVITGNFHNYGDSITSDVSDFFGTTESTIKLTADSILFKQTAGRYFFFNIPAANDSSLNKPIAYNTATKTLRVMDGWPGGGGSGSTNGVGRDTVQAYASGATLTQGTSTNYIQVNPTSLQATLTVTTLASGGTWHTSNDLYIVFGGTVTNGSPVITSFTLTPGSGLTVVWSTDPSGLTYYTGNTIRIHKIGTILYVSTIN